MPTISIDTDARDKRAEDLEKEIEKSLEEYSKDLESVDSDNKKEAELQPDPLADFIRTTFGEADKAREETEKRWLEDLRQYRGQYDPEILEKMSANRSRAFVRLTRNKVKTVDSRLTDFLFPANGDQNWDIEPTPIPDIRPEQMAGIIQLHEQQTGQPVTQEQFEVLVQEFAQEKAGKMGRQIRDQLSELQYRETLKDVLHSGNLYGTGVLKGPLVSVATERKYKRERSEDGVKTWSYEEHDRLTPFIESVPIWDIYPDMSATSMKDARYVIQRHKMDKSKLVELSKRNDFDHKVITEYLRKFSDGDFERKYFESELQSMGNRTATEVASPTPGKKFEILEYWGYIDVEDLETYGIDVPEKAKGQIEAACNIWILGDHIIKATVAPMQGIEFPYFFYYYDKDETSIFGEGIASIMRDPQELINSSFRAMLDNAAIAAGPQIEANLDLLPEDEDPTEVYPFKVWLRSGDGADANAPAVRVFDMGSYTQEYLVLNEALEKYADEVTTIPRYMWGDQAGGAGRTASGLSMMMGSANITIKDQVKNFDDGITKPFIAALYHWNMQFNNDEGIKGDYNIVAKGTSSLIAREVYAQSLMQFANITNNPTDLPMVKRDKIIRGIAEALDLGDKGLVRTETEVTAQQQQADAQRQAEQQFMMQMTETARENGISPNDLVNNMRAMFTMSQQAAQNAQ